jgi:hypothetical protein
MKTIFGTLILLASVFANAANLTGRWYVTQAECVFLANYNNRPVILAGDEMLMLDIDDRGTMKYLRADFGSRACSTSFNTGFYVMGDQISFSSPPMFGGPCAVRLSWLKSPLRMTNNFSPNMMTLEQAPNDETKAICGVTSAIRMQVNKH